MVLASLYTWPSAQRTHAVHLRPRQAEAAQGQIRTLKLALEARLQAKIPTTHPLMEWLVLHSSFLWSKYKSHRDPETWMQFTGYGLLHGKEVDERIAEFGEVVMFSTAAKHRTKLEPTWR